MFIKIDDKVINTANVKSITFNRQNASLNHYEYRILYTDGDAIVVMSKTDIFDQFYESVPVKGYKIAYFPDDAEPNLDDLEWQNVISVRSPLFKDTVLFQVLTVDAVIEPENSNVILVDPFGRAYCRYGGWESNIDGVFKHLKQCVTR